jgi:transcription initiation factor TFIIF subunit alpha
MPPKSAESLLFHKKKSIKKEPSTPSTTSQGSQPSQSQPSLRKSATPRIQPTPPDADADDSSKLPEGEFAEYKLMSSALNGWKYDVMKFDSRKTVDISTWEEPIKLNRKELRREDSGPSTQVPTGPMLGADGKPVVGPDGKIVMVDADGRPIANNGGEAPSKEKDKGKAAGRKKFQKKTRQVFLVPEATRQLRREERYPWVMEDAKQNEMWVGKLEEVAKAETHALFMPAAQEVFKFVPANRWYKFQKKPKHYVPGLEEAEALVYCPLRLHHCVLTPHRWPRFRRTKTPNVGCYTEEKGREPQQQRQKRLRRRRRTALYLAARHWSTRLGRVELWVGEHCAQQTADLEEVVTMTMKEHPKERRRRMIWKET